MRLKRIFCSLMIGLLLAMQAPMLALADTASDPAATTTPTDQSTQPSTSPTTQSTDPAPPPAPAPAPDPGTTNPAPPPPPPAPTTGPDKPTGKAPDYAFNDATHKWEPTIISSFSWDAASGLWLSPFYTYDTAVGWYHVKPQVTPSDAISGLTAGSSDPAKTLAGILGANDPLNSNTGAGSTNNSSLNNHNSLLENLINNASINNFNASTALSGDASVSGNNSGGSATTGAATVVANLLNLLNAMWSWSNGGLSYFVKNIFGNQTGDINIDPGNPLGGGGTLGGCPEAVDGNQNTGPGSTNTADTNCTNDVTVHSQNTGAINNNVNLLAQSGDANVGGNTSGGDATSGDARAELNIVNLINSAIGSGQSFFGLFNIYGNLNGDILFPTLGLNGVVGSSAGGSTVSNDNTGPNSTNQASSNNSNNATLDNNNTGAFNNNIQTAAQSGNANTSGNTSAGNATTGTADTNTSLFNLFDTSVFGDNAVLVLVNNMGHWMGQIMNLALGDGGGGALATAGATVSNSNTGPGSSNQSSSNNANNLDVTNNNSGTINNNVKVGAVSGNANVSGNTTGGNATSGNASVAANVANIFGSHLSFKHVFGILLINVFGSWTGSVGVNTAAGTVPPVITVIPLAASTSSSSAHVLAQSTGSATSGGASNNQTSTTNASGSSLQAIASSQLKAEQAKAASDHSVAIVLLIMAFMLMGAAGLFSLERKLSKK